MPLKLIVSPESDEELRGWVKSLIAGQVSSILANGTELNLTVSKKLQESVEAKINSKAEQQINDLIRGSDWNTQAKVLDYIKKIGGDIIRLEMQRKLESMDLEAIVRDEVRKRMIAFMEPK